MESTVSDRCYAVGDDHGSNACTVQESTVSDGCHAVGDGDGGEIWTICESIVSDGCHAVGDDDGSKAFAIIVFASCFISTICALNGRKVMI